MVASFLIIVFSGGLKIQSEVENSELEKKSLDVVAQIEEIYDDYIANPNTQRVQKVEIDGDTYIGVLIIPSLDNMSLRCNRKIHR